MKIFFTLIHLNYNSLQSWNFISIFWNGCDEWIYFTFSFRKINFFCKCSFVCWSHLQYLQYLLFDLEPWKDTIHRSIFKSTNCVSWLWSFVSDHKYSYLWDTSRFILVRRTHRIENISSLVSWGAFFTSTYFRLNIIWFHINLFVFNLYQ